MKKYFLIVICFISQINSQTIDKVNLLKYSQIADSISRFCLVEQNGYKMLAEITALGHRMSGSDNLEKAIQWSANKMKNLGFDNVILQPVFVPNWKRGKIEKATISKSKFFINKNLKIASLGNSIPTEKYGIEAEVIEVKSFDQLKKLKEFSKGKIIFFNRPLDKGLVNTFEGYGGAVNQRSSGAVESALAGGVFALIRSVTTKDDNIPHVGTMHYNDTLRKIPTATIGSIDADFLSAALKKEPHLKIKIIMNCENNPEVKSYNIIGEIKGSEKPQEIIALGGHIDSWDQGTGANDDASGCIQSMEVLQIFKRLGFNPRRTIRCIFFANEENGISGALGYKNYVDSLKENHLALIESDRGAGTPRGFAVQTDSIIFQKLQSWLPVFERVRIDFIRKGGSGVDVSQIKDAKALFGLVTDEQRYMDLHHSGNDTFETINSREFELGTAAMAMLIYLLDREEITN